jgi:short-subunit dehydrogenase
MARPLALITGASKGIGFELAQVFAENSHDLILVARDATRLKTLAQLCESKFKVRAYPIQADLLDPNAVEKIRNEVTARELHVDVLVNNAGFGDFGPFVESDPKKNLDMIQLNISSLVALTHAFLPGMKSRGRGFILQVASTAGFQPGPLMAVYYATKAFVLSFSEALAEELRDSGIMVTALCPGPTASEFQKVAAMEGSRLVGGNLDSPRMVAEEGFRALMRGKRYVIPGWRFKILPFLIRLSPRKWVTWGVYQIQKRI